MYGVRNSSWNPTLFVFPNKNSDLRMKEREILDWSNPIYKPMLSVWCYSLYPCLSFFLFFLSLLCVCNCSLFVFPPLCSLFFLVCPPSIYRETPKELFLFFSLNWSDHGAVFVSFSSTIRVFWLNIAKFKVNWCYRYCFKLFSNLRKEKELRQYHCRK